jgi:hypothetical protein
VSLRLRKTQILWEVKTVLICFFISNKVSVMNLFLQSRQSSRHPIFESWNVMFMHSVKRTSSLLVLMRLGYYFTLYINQILNYSH